MHAVRERERATNRRGRVLSSPVALSMWERECNREKTWPELRSVSPFRTQWVGFYLLDQAVFTDRLSSIPDTERDFTEDCLSGVTFSLSWESGNESQRTRVGHAYEMENQHRIPGNCLRP
jgi:hypothetical protein